MIEEFLMPIFIGFLTALNAMLFVNSVANGNPFPFLAFCTVLTGALFFVSLSISIISVLLDNRFNR